VKIAVISDLHLGVGDRSDRFGHDGSCFLRFLRFLEANFERIVLLGDIWDPMTTPERVPAPEGLRRCREAHRALSDRFETKPYVYVHGNHDLAAEPLLGAPAHCEVEADRVRILFTHGHHHDILVRRLPWLSELGIWLGSWLLRVNLGVPFRWFDRIDNLHSGVSGNASSCSFQRSAVETARAQRADVVVTGHTHLPLKAQHDDVLFLNSGTCVDGRLSFLSLDTARGDFAVNTGW
jgi:predicted phosphodiesterase